MQGPRKTTKGCSGLGPTIQLTQLPSAQSRFMFPRLPGIVYSPQLWRPDRRRAHREGRYPRQLREGELAGGRAGPGDGLQRREGLQGGDAAVVEDRPERRQVERLVLRHGNRREEEQGRRRSRRLGRGLMQVHHRRREREWSRGGEHCGRRRDGLATSLVLREGRAASTGERGRGGGAWASVGRSCRPRSSCRLATVSVEVGLRFVLVVVFCL